MPIRPHLLAAGLAGLSLASAPACARDGQADNDYTPDDPLAHLFRPVLSRTRKLDDRRSCRASLSTKYEERA